MAAPHISVIPAAPGYVTLYKSDGKLLAGEPVIAWRIESHWESERFSTDVHPITLEGDVASNWVGFIHPDGTASVVGNIYNSLADAQEDQTA